MPNKPNTVQWLKKAYHDLSSARLLYDADHYTDTIANDLQQAVEKMLKSFLVYENKPVKKTHNLIEIYELVSDCIQLEEAQVRILGIATIYYTQDRYPGPADLPPREQVREILGFAEWLFAKVCGILDIDEKDII